MRNEVQIGTGNTEGEFPPDVGTEDSDDESSEVLDGE